MGGGDIAFPCLLTASVYFAQGLKPAAIIAVFGLLGLVSVYAIQSRFLERETDAGSAAYRCLYIGWTIDYLVIQQL